MVGYQGVGSFDNDNRDGDENCDYYHNYYHYYYYYDYNDEMQSR